MASKTTAEFVDLVRSNVTLNCKLPYTLGNDNIERVLEYDAYPYFYREYKYATHKTYYYVDLLSMYKNKKTNTKFFYLPDEIQSIKWIYQVNYNDMRNLGYIMPKNSLSMGMTSSPYVAAINVSEFMESVAVMQSLADAMSMFAKNTVKFSFDPNSKRFEIMTASDYNLILEVNANIPKEYLHNDPWFIKYVTGVTMMDYATHLSFVNMELVGASSISTDRVYSRGEALVQEVKDYIKGITKTSWFINKTN
jgi:hypothetical protein